MIYIIGKNQKYPVDHLPVLYTKKDLNRHSLAVYWHKSLNKYT